MAARLGFEPRCRTSEDRILPLDDLAMVRARRFERRVCCLKGNCYSASAWRACLGVLVGMVRLELTVLRAPKARGIAATLHPEVEPTVGIEPKESLYRSEAQPSCAIGNLVEMLGLQPRASRTRSARSKQTELHLGGIGSGDRTRTGVAGV